MADSSDDDDDTMDSTRAKKSQIFDCQICHFRPPVIVTKCCCNTWYSGPELMLKTHPVCQTKRGCNDTVSLCGLTQFMEGVQKLYRSNSSNEQHTQDETHLLKICD